MNAALAVAEGWSPAGVLPFAGLLLAIAFLPLVAPRWWHRNRNKALVSLLFGVPMAVWVGSRDAHALQHALLEYGAFVALLGSLYAISGGVRVRGSFAGTPLSNTAILAFGAVLANLVGTTGASMLLIRPFLRANERRIEKAHLVVFFILVVSNVGGCLTPLGDPPLFLGFLRGVPFFWTLGLWKEWALAVAALLVLFNAYDQRHFVAEDLARKVDLVDEVQPRERVSLEGAVNLFLLLGVIAAALAGGTYAQPRWGESAGMAAQAGAMVLLALVSLAVTSKRIREENEFHWHPFVEVVLLFAAIFVSMVPALDLLRTVGPSIGLSRPWHFFWATGGLSAVLDNAPTYLAFLSVAQFLPDEVAGTTASALAAVSCGAVFFGAATYIGNGPNFMVKAIAEHAGVRMPSFLGYLAWSAAILGPVLLLVTLVFFAG